MPDVLIDTVNRIAKDDERVKESSMETIVSADGNDEQQRVGQMVGMPTTRAQLSP